MSDEAPGLERLLRRERLIVAMAIAALCALAWAYLLNGAGMGAPAWAMTRLSLFPHLQSPGGMSGMPRMAAISPAAVPVWSAGLWALSAAMWWTMMVAMMAPSAAPTILLYGQVQRRASAMAGAAAIAPTGAFAAGYLLVWLGFSLAAALTQWALAHARLIAAAAMDSQSRRLSGGLLLAAGVYQLTSLQAGCLSHCRSPAAFLTRHWRPGPLGALRLGVLHGAYCVGCCWVLMALLFVGGVMNLAWIAALTLLVSAQKLAPKGRWIAQGAGLALIALGIVTLFA